MTILMSIGTKTHRGISARIKWFLLLSLSLLWFSRTAQAQQAAATTASTASVGQEEPTEFETSLFNNTSVTATTSTADQADSNSPSSIDEDDTSYTRSSTSGSSPQHALLYPWVVQMAGVVVFFVLQHFELPIPYAAVMFVIGICMGVAALRLGDHSSDDVDNTSTSQFHNSIRQWSSIDSQVLLLVFLPGLIFRDAIEINILIFRKCLSQLLVLAFPMVLVGTVLTAAVMVYVLPQDDFTWSLGLTVGSVLASTDPVAVTAVLKQADAPPRLQMHLGGESMLNDGAAVVFFLIFSHQFLAELDLPSGDTVTIGQGIATFFRMSLGGVAVGLLFAAGLLVLLYELDRRLEKENNVLQVAAAVSTAYLSYYCSEQVCSMSGVIACVTAGVTAKAMGNGLIADPALMDSYLTLLEHLLNTLLFTLGGTVFGGVIANSGVAERADFTFTDWWSLFLLYVFVMLIRAAQVLLFYPAISRLGLSTNWKEMTFFSFAGLRGAVGIALALALDSTVREETKSAEKRAITSTVVGLAGGVSFLTLIVNGTLAGWLLRQLGLTPPVTSRKRALRLFEGAARDFILHAYYRLRNDQHQRFASVHFNCVKDHLPFLSNVEQEYVDSMMDQLLQQASNNTSKFFGLHTPRSDSKFEFLEELEDGLRANIREPTRGGLTADSMSNLQCPEEVKADIREIFLKMLDAAYQAELTHGELDLREDNGFNYEALHQSVVYGVEDCHQSVQEPLHDWKQANMFSYHDGADMILRRFVQWCKNRFLRDKATTDYNQEYQQLRVRVLRALVFMDAHRRAEAELQSYLESNEMIFEGTGASSGMAGIDIETAIRAVLEESRTQVREAQEWLLSDVEPQDLQNIRAHYMVSILLHKLALFVEKAVADGKLKEKEGRLYLAQIDQRVDKAHNCKRTHSCEDGGSRRRRRKQRSTGSNATSSSLDVAENGTAGRRWPRLKQNSTGSTASGSRGF